MTSDHSSQLMAGDVSVVPRASRLEQRCRPGWGCCLGLQGGGSQAHSHCREIAIFMPVWHHCLAAFHKGSLCPSATRSPSAVNVWLPCKLEKALRGWPRYLTWFWACRILSTRPLERWLCQGPGIRVTFGFLLLPPTWESFFLVPPVALSLSCDSNTSH